MRLLMFPAGWALGLCLLLGCGRDAPDGLALVGATLIDGSGGPALPDAVVVVRKGRIESVGTRKGFTLPDRTTEVELAGRWIIPGLIDSHVHLTDGTAGALDWTLLRYLAWGVTTVRDAHGGLEAVLELREALNGGSEPGPRMYAAGAEIDGLPTTYADAIGANRPNDARRGVDRLVNSGTDFVKVYTRVDPTLLAAVLDEAKTFNLRVSGHLGLTDAVTAARAGLASLEHLSGVPEAATGDASSLYAAHYRSFFAGWTASERAWAGLDSAALDRVARELARAQVVVVPTLVLHETFGRLDDPAVLPDSVLALVPAEAQRNWNVPDLIARAGWTADDFAAFRHSRAAQDLFVRRFEAAGGRIAAGTDAANQMLVPGYSLHQEMQLLVGAGLTPRDALLTATRNGALVLGLDSLGLIAPGKAADLVVLSRDPLADIRNTLAITQVMSRGTLLSPDSLRRVW
ncbi:MAG TPA: amidohydrolase family protein [Gemmatimonadales bacterium]|nr:amidohydrolase family protein [Gemmatimonadales bacterium]